MPLKQTGRGAVWLARLHGVQEAPGSNPGAPTRKNMGALQRPFVFLVRCSARSSGVFQYQMFGNQRVQLIPRLKADDLLYRLPVFEQDQRRDTLDTK